MSTRRGTIVLAALGVAAVALIAVELGLGALSYGEPHLADPCTSKPAFSGGGIDGAVQRFALSGLNGAACRLHTSREQLVLSFTRSAKTKVKWDRATIDAALQAGFTRAAQDTVGGGVLGSLAGVLFRDLLADPLTWLLGRTG